MQHSTKTITSVKQDRGTHKFDQGSVLSVLLKTALPIVILMFFNSMYAFVDSMMSSVYVEYGSITSSTGKDIGLDGGTMIGLIMPLMSLLIAFEVMIAVGDGLAYTQSLAQKNYEEAQYRHEESMGLILYFGLAISAITAIIGLPYILTASGNWGGQHWGEYTKQMSLDGYMYMIVLSVAFIPMQLQQSYTRVLRAEGKGSMAAMIPIATMPLNIFFDWLFMHVLNMGVWSAGLATLIAALFGLLLMVIYVSFQTKHDGIVLRVRAPHFRLHKAIVATILLFSMGSLLRRVFDGLSMVILSTYVGNISPSLNPIDVGGGAMEIVQVTDWTGAWTVMTRSINMGNQLSLGVAQAMSMLISYFTNSEQKDKVGKTLKYGALSMIVCSLSSVILLTGMQGLLFNLYDPASNAFDTVSGYGWNWGNTISIAFMLALIFSIPVSMQTFPVMFYASTKKPKNTLMHSLTFNGILIVSATIGLIINHQLNQPLYLFGSTMIGAFIGLVVVLMMFKYAYVCKVEQREEVIEDEQKDIVRVH